MSIICIDEQTEALTECPTATQSRVIINGIDHDTATTIEITIPEEFQRDYTGTEDTMTVNISGYNVDNTYIDNIIAQEQITPTNEDIEYFVGSIANYLPLIFVGLFAILIAKRILNAFR